MNIFQYGQKETDWLCARDATLGQYIRQRGFIQRNIYPEPFLGLCRAVIGQQLGNQAHDAIWRRFLAAFPELSPQILSELPAEAIKACGISLRKAQTIRAAACLFAQAEFAAPDLLSDGELSEKLLAIKGIGPWTVEMLLIFSFQRKNVLSFGDFALKKGMKKLYGDAEISRAVFESHKRNYSPYSTIAAFYLWDLANN